MDSIFDLKILLPKFQAIGEISSEGLTAFCVLIMLIIFFSSLGYLIVKFVTAYLHFNFYSKILKDVRPQNLIQNRRTILQKASAKPGYGKLWEEFDETLVESPDGEFLYNTLDASYFFNEKTLSHGLVNNRLLAAVPAFLTAIGVLGTFVGLALGLKGLHIDQSAGVEELRQGIGDMIRGASVAFITSVWGVFLSLVINLIEKIVERIIRGRIANLQARIDTLFPRMSPEHSLVKIADYSERSLETLMGLAERIGDKMQEAITQTTESIRSGLEESLERILAPAVQTLVENAHDNSRKVIEEMLTRFLDGVGEAGRAQREMIENASQEFNATVEQLAGHMNHFISSMETQSQEMRKGLTETHSFITHHLSSFSKEEQERQQALFQSLQQIIEKIEMQTQASLETQHQQQQSILGQVDQLTKVQAEEFNTIKNGLATLLDSFQNVASAYVSAGRLMESASANMSSTSSDLNSFSQRLQETTEFLNKEFSEIADTALSTVKHGAEANENLKKGLEHFNSAINELNELANNLKKLTHEATEGLANMHQHLEKFRYVLDDQIKNLDAQTQKLLIHYFEQVKSQTTERLSEWNKQTLNYVKTMQDAITALSEVVDEIDGKIDRQLRK